MKVNDNGANPLAGGGLSPGAKQVGGAQPVERERGVGRRAGVEARGDGDSVQLSSLGQALQAEDIDSPERLQRVEQLRNAVKAGRYEIDADQLGQKLVDDALNGGI
jgi:flagellar biosynthesis anti-sigma factor FlgM